MDINTDQMLFVGKYAYIQPTIYAYPGRDFQKEEIAANPTELRIDSQLTGQKDLLNPKQRLLYNTVIYYFKDVLLGRNLLQLLLNVNRRARTSKSYIIKLVLVYLQKIAKRVRRRAPVLRLVPTSVTIYAINGQTLYKLLKLLARSAFEELLSTTLQTVQADLYRIIYLIIDEKSIIGLS